jgi:hypothetical protein
MMDDLNKILDECIDRINRGESVDACLNEYPDYKEELGILLSTMLETKTAYFFTPSARSKNLQRQRFTSALVTSREKREKRQPLFFWKTGWARVWTVASVAIAIVLVTYFFAFRPEATPPIMVTQIQPNPEGNFVFLLSDEVNAISEFKTLNLSISKISLHPDGNEKEIFEFEPVVQTVDLTNLQGPRAQEIWRGSIPTGEYNKVFLEVSQVSGILLDSGEEIVIKLPSNKLQISKPFKVESGELTIFVYDLTVVHAGKSGQYILKPQIDQSGSDQDFTIVEPEEKPKGNEKIKETGKDKKSSENFIPLPASVLIDIWHSSLQSCHISLPRQLVLCPTYLPLRI